MPTAQPPQWVLLRPLRESAEVDEALDLLRGHLRVSEKSDEEGWYTVRLYAANQERADESVRNVLKDGARLFQFGHDPP